MSYEIGVLHLKESVDSSLNDAVGVGRALALGKHVLHADALEDGTHSTTSDNASTRGSGFKEDSCTAVLAGLLVRDSSFEHRDTDKILLGIVDTLLDSGLDLLGFAEAVANHTIFIADDDNSSEGESTTTLGNLSYTVDSDETLFELDIARFNSFNVYFCLNKIRILNHLLWLRQPTI